MFFSKTVNLVYQNVKVKPILRPINEFIQKKLRTSFTGVENYHTHSGYACLTFMAL